MLPWQYSHVCQSASKIHSHASLNAVQAVDCRPADHTVHAVPAVVHQLSGPAHAGRCLALGPDAGHSGVWGRQPQGLLCTLPCLSYPRAKQLPVWLTHRSKIVWRACHQPHHSHLLCWQLMLSTSRLITALHSISGQCTRACDQHPRCSRQVPSLCSQHSDVSICQPAQLYAASTCGACMKTPVCKYLGQLTF